MLKKNSSFYFLIIVSTIITFFPITGHARSDTMQVNAYCSKTPAEAQWVQLFSGKPNTKVSLRTDGLLFNLSAWKNFIKGKEAEVLYDLYLGSIMELNSRGIMTVLSKLSGDLFDNIALSISFSGKDNLFKIADFTQPLLFVLHPNHINEVDIQAACTNENMVAPAADTSSLFSTLSNPENTTFFDDLAEKSSIAMSRHMWPRDAEIACEKGQGIAIKFSRPNSKENTNITYFGTLTIVTDDQPQAAAALPLGTPMAAAMVSTTHTQ